MAGDSVVLHEASPGGMEIVSGTGEAVVAAVGGATIETWYETMLTPASLDERVHTLGEMTDSQRAESVERLRREIAAARIAVLVIDPVISDQVERIRTITTVNVHDGRAEVSVATATVAQRHGYARLAMERAVSLAESAGLMPLHAAMDYARPAYGAWQLMRRFGLRRF